jgi:hypothetical protein
MADASGGAVGVLQLCRWPYKNVTFYRQVTKIAPGMQPMPWVVEQKTHHFLAKAVGMESAEVSRPFFSTKEFL